MKEFKLSVLSEYEVTDEEWDILNTLVFHRLRCRVKKEWERADEIRAKIEGMGYKVKDTEDGVLLDKPLMAITYDQWKKNL